MADKGDTYGQTPDDESDIGLFQATQGQSVPHWMLHRGRGASSRRHTLFAASYKDEIMSETTDTFNAIKDHAKALRAKYGVECPTCKKARPRVNATIRLPGQRCPTCKTVDPRPELTDEEWKSV